MEITKESLKSRYSCVFEDAFLKCKYFPGDFSQEYFIEFNSVEGRSISIVEGENLIKGHNLEGCVKVFAFDYSDYSTIVINGSKEDAGKFYSVPKEDLIYGKEEIIPDTNLD